MKKDKSTPRPDKEYLVTDQCMWSQMSAAEQAAYNPYDKTRAVHALNLIDIETGTVVNLMSGSIVRVVKARK